jgi:DNA polymerase-1
MPIANDGPAASAVLQRLRKAATVVLDVETSGLDPWKNYPIGWVLTFGPKPEDSSYVPIRHQGGGNLPFGEQRFVVPEDKWEPAPFEIEMFKLLHGKRIVGHNLAFDLGFLSGLDTTQSKFNDTMVMAYLVDELRPSFSLADCCLQEKVAAKKGDELYKYLAQTLGVPEKKSSMGFYWQTNAEASIVHDYACSDGTSTWQLWETLYKQIEAQDLGNVHRLESRLLPVLHRLRMRGVKVDRSQLGRVLEEVEKQAAAAQKVVGDTNVRSAASVSKYLQENGITAWPLTEKGAPNFSERWLMTNEPGRTIVAARKYRTLRDFFLRPLIEQHLRGDRVHSEWHQTKNEGMFGTVTARISSSNPNFTQIPGKRQGERGKFFRSMFVPDCGKWYEADFKACELRIGAHYSKAKLWLDGFANGVDPHTAVAQQLGIPRAQAKVITLGTMMCMGTKRLASELGVDPMEGATIMSRYFSQLPELKRLQQQAAQVFERRGYIRSITGRRFRLDEPKNAFRAVNRLTQGGNADLQKSRIVEMDEVAEAHPGTALLVNVHDSIGYQTDSEEADRAMRLTMIGTEHSAVKFDVPMEIEVGSGDSWGSATFQDVE